jgi:hypothetical protein
MLDDLLVVVWPVSTIRPTYCYRAGPIICSFLRVAALALPSSHESCVKLKERKEEKKGPANPWVA